MEITKGENLKFHVFIATTQGVVAIQDVIPLNDPEIHSLISVNGTATVANISSNYHHFVKKGSGIIHQDFSSCSFRINISQRIDQGNSWQLAIYLAHFLEDRKLLTYGDIQADDQIIIATGEVNTSNRNVQSVQHIQEKYNHIVEFIHELTKNKKTMDSHSNKPTFLIPDANINDFTQIKEIIDVFSLSQLSQLPSRIPVLSLALENNNQQTEKQTEHTTIKKGFPNKFFTGRYTKEVAAILIVSLLVLVSVGMWTPLDNSVDFEQKTTLTFPLTQAQEVKNSDSSKLEKRDELANNIMEPYVLKATYAKYKQCNERTEEKITLPIKRKFTSTNRHKLCQLSFTTLANVKHVYWLDNNKSSLLVLKPEPELSSELKQEAQSLSSVVHNNIKKWSIPLPKNQQRDIGYFLIVITNESDDQLFNKESSDTFTQQLNDFLIKDIHSPIVTEKQLTSWLMSIYKSEQNQVYQHKLIVY